MFHRDGSASAAGWTFHGTTPDHVTLVGLPRDGAGEEARSSRVSASKANGRADILEAVRGTADRHADNRALVAVGLTGSEWHALFRALIQAERGHYIKVSFLSGPFERTENLCGVLYLVFPKWPEAI